MIGTRSRRKIDLENDVIASPSKALINNGTPQNNVMRRRSMGTPSLRYLLNTPSYVDSPNRTLNETFSPEPEEKVFFRTLVDSVKKRKRHTSSAVSEANVYDTPRITRATLNSGKKSRTSIKKAHKSSPDFANLEKIVSKTPKTMFLHTAGEVADFVAGDAKVIKSIRKTKRSSSVNDTLVSEKKNVKFHSPANMEVSTFDIDFKMQSDRKVLKRLRSFSNAETDKDKDNIKKTVTPERVEKTKTPRSRKKMPNFVEIHQRHFEKMESITEHAARKAERAKILIRSPKITPKRETLHVEEPKTSVIVEPEPKFLLDSKVMFKEEAETKVVQELEPEVLPEPVLVIDQESEIKTETSEPNLFQKQQPLEMEKLDNLTLQIGSPSISTSHILRSPFAFGKTCPELQISKPDLSFLTESGQRRETNIVGRSPFAVEVLKSFSIPSKSPAIRPKALSRIPGKIKTADKNQTMQPNLPKTPKQDLNATVSKIPQPKSSSSVLTLSNKINTSSTKNDVFVFQANKTALKPVNPVKPNLKRTKSMVAIKPRQAVPMRPAKENHLDKVKERQQKNMSMYKGRPDPVVKSRPAGPKNMIAVRTNKRFELQMKFRQMNANN